MPRDSRNVRQKARHRFAKAPTNGIFVPLARKSPGVLLKQSPTCVFLLERGLQAPIMLSQEFTLVRTRVERSVLGASLSLRARSELSVSVPSSIRIASSMKRSVLCVKDNQVTDCGYGTSSP